jgi:hypothetical protein
MAYGSMMRTIRNTVLRLEAPEVRPTLGRFVLLVLCSLGTVTTASAQLESDEVPHTRIIAPTEAIRQELEDSRYHLGPMRVRPLFSLRDVGYDNNVLGTSVNQVADFHSTVGLGAHGVLPVGSKMYFQTVALPEYTWYQKLTDRRSLGGSYSGSLLGLFNRMSVEAGADSFRGPTVLNSEQQTSVPATRTHLFSRVEVEFLKRLSVYGSGESEQQRYSPVRDDPTEAAAILQLERNETAARGGLRYRFASWLDFSLGVEHTNTTFLTGTDRDNHSDAVILGVRYDRPRSFINLSVGSRTGKADHPGVFPDYSATTGSYYASHDLSAPVAFDVYGHRGIGYSITATNPYYLETRNGAGVTVAVGRRLALRGFGEGGSNAYPVPIAVGSTSVKRMDSAVTAGGGVAFRLHRKVALSVLASNSRYTSNIAGNDRSIFRLATGISFTGDFFR